MEIENEYECKKINGFLDLNENEWRFVLEYWLACGLHSQTSC